MCAGDRLPLLASCRAGEHHASSRWPSSSTLSAETAVSMVVNNSLTRSCCLARLAFMRQRSEQNRSFRPVRTSPQCSQEWVSEAVVRPSMVRYSGRWTSVPPPRTSYLVDSVVRFAVLALFSSVAVGSDGVNGVFGVMFYSTGSTRSTTGTVFTYSLPSFLITVSAEHLLMNRFALESLLPPCLARTSLNRNRSPNTLNVTWSSAFRCSIPVSRRCLVTSVRVASYRRVSPENPATLNYSVNHARSGPDSCSASTAPLVSSISPLHAAAIVRLPRIFMTFAG
jgi:hypothetical protein